MKKSIKLNLKKSFLMSRLIWITGLSGSGKTTIAQALFLELKKIEENTVFLDGDNFREILGNDLKYSKQDRLINAKGFIICVNF